VTYKKTIQVDDLKRASVLVLGAAYDISEVMLNGEPLGIRWYGRHLYDIRDAVQVGENDLEIKVTTVLYNYIRNLKNDSCAVYWAKRAQNKQSVPAGLAGPVGVGPRKD
jgi:hypothetical protein